MEDYAVFLKRIFLKITTDEVTFIKQVSVHPRDRLKNKKLKPIHSPDKMKRKTQQIPAENVVTLLKVMFNFSTKNILSKTILFDTSRIDEEKVLSKILEALPADNDKLCFTIFYMFLE